MRINKELRISLIVKRKNFINSPRNLTPVQVSPLCIKCIKLVPIIMLVNYIGPSVSKVDGNMTWQRLFTFFNYFLRINLDKPQMLLKFSLTTLNPQNNNILPTK